MIPNVKDSHDADVVITWTRFKNKDLGLFFWYFYEINLYRYYLYFLF